MTNQFQKLALLKAAAAAQKVFAAPKPIQPIPQQILKPIKQEYRYAA